MLTAIGTSISDNIAIGPLRVYRRAEPTFSASSGLTPAGELVRLESARLAALEQLETLYRHALDAAGPKNAAIFRIHQMMLEDDDYLDAVRTVIHERGATAEYAVAAIRQQFADTFAAMKDDYMRARAADVQDVSLRLVNLLTRFVQPPIPGDIPAILAADDLTPSEAIELGRSRLLGFITRDPFTHSHAAILARAMGIPALVGVDFDESWDGRLSILDGRGRCLYVDPTAELLDAMTRRLNGTRQPLLQV